MDGNIGKMSNLIGTFGKIIKTKNLKKYSIIFKIVYMSIIYIICIHENDA